MRWKYEGSLKTKILTPLRVYLQKSDMKQNQQQLSLRPENFTPHVIDLKFQQTSLGRKRNYLEQFNLYGFPEN